MQDAELSKPMKHDPLSNAHNAILTLIERRKLCKNCIVVVCHTDELQTKGCVVEGGLLKVYKLGTGQ